MAAPTLEERTSRLEGGCDHLATKADLERVRGEVERIRADVSRWMLQLTMAIISAVGVVAGIVLAIVKLT